MKEYFKRNSPIFYIGILTAVLFLAIIFAGQGTPNVKPSLEKVSDEELYTNLNPIIGEKTARVTIVEFLDYNCPACAAVNPIIKATIQNNPGKIRLIVRHLPLNIPGHESSKDAAIAATAAIKFNKFEVFHNELFNINKKDRETFISMAEKFGINKEEYISQLDSEEVKKIVENDVSTASKLNLRGTPSLFINGRPFDNSQDLNTVILAEMNKIYPQN